MAALSVLASSVACGSDESAAPTSSAAELSEELTDGGTITYSSIGARTGLDCGQGKSLNVVGSNNTLTVSGTCSTVTVGGPDNRITVERIARELIVVGFHNTITYHDGDPAVSDTGDANTITKS